MRNIQVNVLRVSSGVFKYSIEPKAPMHNPFIHDFNVQDQITWHSVQPGQKVRVSFPTDICPFALANGNAWPGKTNTFPDQPSKLVNGFDMNRLYSRIKYTIVLLDSSGTELDHDDPEVIIVDA